MCINNDWKVWFLQTSTNWIILAYLAAFLRKISILFPIVTQLSPSAPDLSRLIPTVSFIKLALLSHHPITSLPVCLSARLPVRPPTHPSVGLPVRPSARPSICVSGRSSDRPTTRLSDCTTFAIEMSPPKQLSCLVTKILSKIKPQLHDL